MKDENQILEDSSLNLAIEMDNASSATEDVTTAMEITVESSLKLAEEQYKLAKLIERRKKLEKKLNDYQKLIDYTNLPAANQEQIPDKTDNKQSQPTDIDDKPKTANDLIKEQLGTLKEFKKRYVESAKEEQKFRKQQKISMFQNYKKSESLTIRTTGALLNSVQSQFGDLVGGLLNQIPGANTVKNATKFLGDNYRETRDIKRNKRLENDAENAYKTRSETIKSNFQRVETDNISSTETKKQLEIERTQQEENKKQTQISKDESDKNENRFGRLFKFLDRLKQMMLFKSIIGAVGSMFSGLSSVITGGLSMLSVGLIAKLTAVVASLTGLKTIFSNGLRSLMPNSTKTPTDVRTGKPTDTTKPNRVPTSQTQTPDTNATKTDVKPKPDVKSNVKTSKPSMMSKAGATMSKVFKRVPKMGVVKKIAGGAAKRLLPALIGGPLGMALSFGLLASDLVDVGKFAYEQIKGTSEEPTMVMDGDVKSEPKIIIDGADTSQMITGEDLETENRIVQEAQEKQRIAERQEEIITRARMENARITSNVDSSSNVTNHVNSSYPFNYSNPIDNKVF